MRLNASRWGLLAGLARAVFAADGDEMSTTAISEAHITFTSDVFKDTRQIFKLATGDKIINWNDLPDDYRVTAVQLYKMDADDGDVAIGFGAPSVDPNGRTTGGSGNNVRPSRRDSILPEGDGKIAVYCMRPPFSLED